MSNYRNPGFCLGNLQNWALCPPLRDAGFSSKVGATPPKYEWLDTAFITFYYMGNSVLLENKPPIESI